VKPADCAEKSSNTEIEVEGLELRTHGGSIRASAGGTGRRERDIQIGSKTDHEG
jgi:hypothetical protein